MDKISQIRGI